LVSVKEERVEFFSDNLKLVGILDLPEREPPDRIIIFCHGIAYDKNEYNNFFAKVAEFFCENNFAVFRFDFRSHGESEGKQEEMTPTGEARDIDAAIRFVKEKGFRKIGVLAQSFGGSPSVLSVERNQNSVSALALWASMIDYSPKFSNPKLKHYIGPEDLKKLDERGYFEFGSRKFKMGKACIEEMKTMKPWQHLGKIKIPILLVHGDKDPYVPYEDSIKYAKMFGKEFKIIKGGEHGDERFLAGAKPVTLKFFKENLK